MSIIDERANDAQRTALETISQGRASDPGSTLLYVFSTVVSHLLPTQYKPIELTIDYAARTASLRIPGLLDSTAEPIKNPVTGLPHRAIVTLPKGFEYTEAEFVAGTARVSGPIELHFDGTHSHIARIHWTTHGVVR
jgi:hypothetical protein